MKVREILNYRVSDTPLPKYRLDEIPKLALGAVIIAGGVYGIVTLMLKKKESDELDTLTEIRKAKLASARSNPVASVHGTRGWYGRERGVYR